MKWLKIYGLLLSIALFTSCEQADINPVLNITGGQVQGIETAVPGILVYKGIPYAAPPVGDLRWKAPQPVVAWEGIKVADTFGAAAPQGDKVLSTRESAPGVVDYTKEFFADGDPERSEDCLFLNVWTPVAGKPEAKLPVAMWIHGGAYTQGFGHEIEFDGEAFAERGVILVTLNYRLGIFGFLTHPLLSEESDNHVSGNYGILDQIAALNWIQENIAQFGGDPDNITIFGQSAGAGSVQNLLGSPLTKGKIKKAIIQSGGGLSGLGLGGGRTLAEIEQQSKAAFDESGITTLEEMRKLSFSDLQELQADWRTKRLSVTLSPIVDGYMSTADFATNVRSGVIPNIPYMLGGTKDDMGFAKVGQPYYDFSLELVKLGRKPAYLYDFRRELPGDNAGAFHSSELWYVFGTLDRCWRPMTDGDHALSAKMTDYWTSFIKTGNPNTDNRPEWLPYTEESGFVMALDVE
ncbi:carboxylesterase family protein [Parabacteroides sp. OttesenSCG-928-G07]|nr:carboxylesterase family protein [Parabacteroides sp. OttesenSCG-928-G21]MDL2277453.1 carboxylesterase family protein [Parabacteroides sp. OttesenSCG-928-G07]